MAASDKAIVLATSSLMLLISIFAPLLGTMPKVYANPSLPSTIASPNVYEEVLYSYQRRIYGAYNLYWAFYVQGGVLYYKTSSDGGETWGSAITVKTGGDDYGCIVSLWCNGTHVAYTWARRDIANTPLIFRLGLLNSDGTISWNDEQNAVAATANVAYRYPMIVFDSSNYPIIAYVYHNFTSDKNTAYVTKSDLNNGSWNTASGFPIQVGVETSSGNIKVMVVPLLNDAFYIGYPYILAGVRYEYGRLFNGTLGNQETVSTLGANDPHQTSIVAYQNTVFYARVLGNYKTILSIRSPSGVWTDEYIDTNTNNDHCVALTIHPISGDLISFFSYVPTSGHHYYRIRRLNGQWENTVDWFTDSMANAQFLQSGYSVYNSYALYTYESSATNYPIKFNRLLLPPPTINITYPANTTYTTSTIPVNFSASDGTIDKMWYNCKSGTSWIYANNITYTTPTSMTGFTNGTYTFHAWANNTGGDVSEATVDFTVEIPPPTVTIVNPQNTTYSTSTIPVQISATSDEEIDKIWFNCKNGTEWIYAENQTHSEEPTNMTGFIDGIYTFYAWANATDGSLGGATVTFSVTIPEIPLIHPKPSPKPPSPKPPPYAENFYLFIFAAIMLICIWAVSEIYKRQWLILLPAVPILAYALVLNGIECNTHWRWMIVVGIVAILYGLYRLRRR